MERMQMDSAVQPVIRVTDLVKDYSRGESVVHALRAVSLVRPDPLRWSARPVS